MCSSSPDGEISNVCWHQRLTSMAAILRFLSQKRAQTALSVRLSLPAGVMQYPNSSMSISHSHIKTPMASPSTLLRFFGSYGPRQPLSWWGGPPPVFIEAVLNDKVIPIHGDGKQTRSFTYVSDTVDGIYAAIMRDEANGEVLNVGNDEEVTILELAQRIKAASGMPGELKVEMIPYESFTGKKYEDVRRRVPDTTLSQTILGVKAQVPLDEGLKLTIEWQRRAMKERDFKAS